MAIVRRKTASKIRKTHRYLGLFIGIQFLMWTISGMYFSWTDLDEIHGDHLRETHVYEASFTDLMSPTEAAGEQKIRAMVLKDIAGEPYYWINEGILADARTGEVKRGISEAEALAIADQHMMDGLDIASVEKITSTGKHHEYRGRPLPAWVISYDTPENIKAYVSVADGTFQTLRHRDWRWFDFLWMTHTMDYESRDDFNTIVLRGFSLLGLITVMSGFLLWFISSPRMIKLTGNKKKKKTKR